MWRLRGIDASLPEELEGVDGGYGYGFVLGSLVRKCC